MNRRFAGIHKPYSALSLAQLCGDAYWSDKTREVREHFASLTPTLNDGSRAVLLALLSLSEHGDPLPFWENPHRNGVTVCLPSLARLAGMSEAAVTAGIGELRARGVIEYSNSPLSNEPMHYGLLTRDVFYHRQRRPGGARRQLPNAIRRMVLAVGACLRCGRTSNLSVDHIIPVKLGGSDAITNLQCLCRPCNSAKRDRFIG